MFRKLGQFVISANILLCLINNKLLSQVYQPVLHSFDFYQTYIPGGFCDGIITDTLRFEKDTLINGLLYTKMRNIVDLGYSKTRIEYNYFRQDSSNSKLWMLENQKDKLIYDMSLQIKDSFRIEPTFGNPFYIHVTKVDTIDGRKCIHFNTKFNVCDAQGSEDFYFIEGLGSNGGILYNIYYSTYNIIGPAQSSYLLCASIQNELVYANKFFNGQCYVRIVQTKDYKYSKELNCFPNPSHETVHFKLAESDQMLNGKIELISQEGKILNVVHVKDQTEVNIELPKVESSFLYLRFVDKINTSTCKILLVE